MAKIAKIIDFLDNSGPSTIDDFENRPDGGIYTQHYGKAEIRIGESNTPPSLGPVDQIAANVVVD